jgi:ribosomal protein S14
MGIIKLRSKDKLKRLKITVFEDKQKCLKSLKHNIKLQNNWWSRHKLSSTIKRTLKNRCLITGRGQSINKNFKISRLEFARWVENRILTDVKKASW